MRLQVGVCRDLQYDDGKGYRLCGNLTLVDPIGSYRPKGNEIEIVKTNDSNGAQAPALVKLIKQHAKYRYTRGMCSPRDDTVQEIVDMNAFNILELCNHPGFK